jgi:hypothetical protein
MTAPVAWPPQRTGPSEHEGGSNSVVESQPSKLLVAGSIPVSRSSLCSLCTGHGWPATDADQERRTWRADVAQLAERVLGKDEVSSSILDIGSRDAMQRAWGSSFTHYSRRTRI